MPFEIVRNDITNMRVDAIVNTANPRPRVGGGTDAGIHAKAGPKLLEARKEIGRISVGEAAITPAFDLNAKYVIHTVGPVWRGGFFGEAKLLRSCYDSALAMAAHHGCESIAFPLISTGSYGFPKDKALQIAKEVISEFLLEHEMMVYLVVFNRDAFQLSEKLFRDVASYIDENYVEQVQKQEYGGFFRVNRRERTMRDCSQGFSAPEERAPSSKAPRPFRPSMPPMPPQGEIPEEPWEMPAEEKVFFPTAPMPPAPPSSPRPPMPPSPPLAAPSKKSVDPEPPAPSLWEAPEESMSAGFDLGMPDGTTLDEMLKNTDAGFSETLLQLIDRTGKKDSEIYTRANISRQHFSKIRNNPFYKPTKATAVAFAIALELDLDQTRDLIGRAGYALTKSSKFDVIIMYFIREGNYDLYDINTTLFKFDQSLLGA